jgi:hypothetical protein
LWFASTFLSRLARIPVDAERTPAKKKMYISTTTVTRDLPM